MGRSVDVPIVAVARVIRFCERRVTDPAIARSLAEEALAAAVAEGLTGSQLYGAAADRAAELCARHHKQAASTDRAAEAAAAAAVTDRARMLLRAGLEDAVPAGSVAEAAPSLPRRRVAIGTAGVALVAAGALTVGGGTAVLAAFGPPSAESVRAHVEGVTIDRAVSPGDVAATAGVAPEAGADLSSPGSSPGGVLAPTPAPGTPGRPDLDKAPRPETEGDLDIVNTSLDPEVADALAGAFDAATIG